MGNHKECYVYHMDYWICTVNNENWEIVKDRNIFGVSERNKNKISQVVEGDIIVFYIRGEKVFAGIYEVVSKMYKDASRLFKPFPTNQIEVFPYRIKLSQIKIFKEPIQIKSIISDLEFIRNKENWGMYFFGKAIRTLPKNDFLLLKQMLV